MGGRRLLKAQLALGLDEDPSDLTATEVLNNIEAMRWAVDTLDTASKITVEHLLAIHKQLLQDTPLERHAGKLREQQNWIGGSSHNPCSAAFVPPPFKRVPELLEDLCAFCNGEDLPAIAQAALAHAQFETIHPFIDGNGRTGRTLIHVILRRRGLAPLGGAADLAGAGHVVAGLRERPHCHPLPHRADRTRRGRRAERLDRPVRSGHHAGRSRRRDLRAQSGRGSSAVAYSPAPSASRSGGGPARQRAARRTRDHCAERRSADLAQRAGSQRGHPPPPRRRSPDARPRLVAATAPSRPWSSSTRSQTSSANSQAPMGTPTAHRPGARRHDGGRDCLGPRTSS